MFEDPLDEPIAKRLKRRAKDGLIYLVVGALILVVKPLYRLFS